MRSDDGRQDLPDRDQGNHGRREQPAVRQDRTCSTRRFPSDYRQIRYFTLLIVQSAPLEIKEINLLEQQISEVIKNAVKHGNKCIPEKKVRVWYVPRPRARLIVQDEEGFQGPGSLERFQPPALEKLAARFRRARGFRFPDEESDDGDGGNALFAALEYWNGGSSCTRSGAASRCSRRAPSGTSA
ncbi:MAG: hypothetical protein MZU84_01265 [Sphingobacterium sp.]|nr:hypothetical protein [Sphingobacterium sp.]